MIFEDAEAAVARINMDGPVSDDELASMREGTPTSSACSWSLCDPIRSSREPRSR